jgi:PPM family protein phosphatase
MPYSILYSARSEIGRRRSNNEDACLADLELGFCLVADGMGGEAAGEIASRLFTEAVMEIFQNAKERNEARVIERVQEAYRLANRMVREYAAHNPEHRGLGCTAELLAFSDNGFVLGHMGDSRTYRFRNHHLNQLTRDHSLVQRQLDSGLISSENVRTHPLRNVITRAVGVDDEISLDLIRGPINLEDIFLLCSDGLTDLVDDNRIAAILDLDTSLDQKVNALVDTSLEAGGYDNVTVVLLAVR